MKFSINIDIKTHKKQKIRFGMTFQLLTLFFDEHSRVDIIQESKYKRIIISLLCVEKISLMSIIHTSHSIQELC
jgi:hypothetical protein